MLLLHPGAMDGHVAHVALFSREAKMISSEQPDRPPYSAPSHSSNNCSLVCPDENITEKALKEEFSRGGVGPGGRTDSALCGGVQAGNPQPFGDLSSPSVEFTLKSFISEVRLRGAAAVVDVSLRSGLQQFQDLYVHSL
ncbi:hypothetical protein MJT46_007378 [Ovis ammon polii x Ovis aries]|nr:hypothetical protein MJT46_007378 [Ovis ammon polii x Ovis aries]